MNEERPVWTVLLATGDPDITYTEYFYSLYALRDFVDYHRGRDLIVFPPGSDE